VARLDEAALQDGEEARAIFQGADVGQTPPSTTSTSASRPPLSLCRSTTGGVAHGGYSMLPFSSIKSIVGALGWLLTLGKSDVKHVQDEIEDLIRELSKSLVSLWDATVTIAGIPEAGFNATSFEEQRDYFMRFYLGPQNISVARTHCGNVQRAIDRITFKVAKVFHTDLGKWREATTKFRDIVNADGQLLTDYDACIETLRGRLESIRHELDNDVAKAKQAYAALKRELEGDIQQLHLGIKAMKAASDHIRRVVG
jgi:hypothetical protein